jgi:hypothetical protein
MTDDEKIAEEVSEAMKELIVCPLCKKEFRKPDEEDDTLFLDGKPWCGCLPF